MKTLVTFCCAFLIGGSVFANDLKWTCESADRSLVVTQDQGFLITKNTVTQSVELTALKNNQPLKALKPGGVIELTTPWHSQQIVLSLKILKLSARQTLAEDYGRACEAHQGPAYHTESFRLEVVVDGPQKSSSVLELSCVETTFWSGSCFKNLH